MGSSANAVLFKTANAGGVMNHPDSRIPLRVENKRRAKFCQTVGENATTDVDPICASKLPHDPVILPNWNQPVRVIAKTQVRRNAPGVRVVPKLRHARA